MPTFANKRDHKEAIRVIFDPAVISYEEILEHFLEQAGLPAQVRCGEPYLPTIYVHNDRQKTAAEHLARILYRTRPRSAPAIAWVSDFYRAEDAHQNYVLNQQTRDSEDTVISMS
jgi:peptide-methionine (S)-S-oxide reductase